MIKSPATSAPSEDMLLGEIAAEFFDRLARGENPDIEEYAQQHAEIADLIREMFPALNLLKHSTGSTPQGVGSKIDPKDLYRLGDYQILGELGRGGMGVVYEARQISLNRRVALKVLPFAAVMDPKQLARFKTEAQAAASLDHPNIVNIYAVGCERSVHFYAMRYIQGQTVQELISELRQLSDVDTPEDEIGSRAASQLTRDLSQDRVGISAVKLLSDADRTVDFGRTSTPADLPSAETEPKLQAAISTQHSVSNKGEFYRSVASLGVQAAAALDHAHVYGVLHRDIKPGNLMIDAEGKLWVTDFGLARIEANVGMTMTGDVLGTLRYMSPEQALAKRGIVDHRADIYSLGVTLYELLSLQPAYAADDRQELLNQIAFKEPCRLRLLDRQIPVELETIVGKAIEKCPTDRYGTAHELADDLQRYLDQHPILAKPPSPINRLVKWSRRHVGVVWTLVLASLALAVAFGTSTVLIAESRKLAKQERKQADEGRVAAIEQRNVALRNRYFAEMVAGQTQVDGENPGGLYTDLIDYLPLSTEEDHRGWEWYYLMSKCRPEVRTITYPGLIPYVAWSPDGKQIAAPAAIWEADSGKCIRRFSTSNIRRYRVAWSPDGSKLAWAMAADENTFYIWDQTSDSVSGFAGHKSSVWCVTWSPDGSQIASSSIDNTIKIWDVASLTVQWSAPTSGHVMNLAWSPNGNLLAVASNRTQIWDMTKQELVKELPRNDFANSVSWHPQGTQLAVSADDRWRVYETDEWNVVHESDLSRGGQAISYNTDGSLVAVTDGEAVTVWNSTGETKVAELVGHRYPVSSLGWHPDGHRLVSGDESREIKIWDLDRLETPHLDAEIEIESVTWLADNRRLIAVDQKDGSSVLINVSDGMLKQRKTLGVEAPVAVSLDRKLAAVYSEKEHAISICDATTGESRSEIAVDEERRFRSAVFAPGGSRLVVQTEEPLVLNLEIWDIDQEKQLWTWESKRVDKASGPLTRVTWNPSGTHFAAFGFGDVGEDGSTYWRDHLHVFDAEEGNRSYKHLPEGRNNILSASWNLDGRMLAIGTEDGRLEVLDTKRGERVFSEKIHRDGITVISWHSAGNRLALGTHDGEVTIVSSKEGKVLLSFAPFQNQVATLAWSNDGQQLAAATSAGNIHTWDASKAYELTSGDGRRGELAWAYRDRSQQQSEERSADSLRAFLIYAPDNLGFWEARGDTLAELGEFERASEEFAKAVGPELPYSFQAARYRAGALLGAGDVDKFQQACSDLVEAFQDSPVPSNRRYIAWLASLTSSPHIDATLVAAMARVGDDGDNDGRLILGGALYRNGQYEEANRLLTELAARLESDGDWMTAYEVACAKYFLSMSRFSLGHKFQSQRLLDEANNLADAYLKRVPGRYWRRIVALKTLRREATSAIGE